VDVLKKKKFILMVSLPANDMQFLAGAQNAGADAAKVHINMVNHASQTRFGSWTVERQALTWMAENAKIPFGIVPGGEQMAPQEDVEEIAASGFDFWDAYLHHMPAYFLTLPRLGRMVAVDDTYTPDDLRAISHLGVDAVEASLFPKGYRKEFLGRDLLPIRTVVECTGLPVLVSTQKAIQPSQVELLARIGVKGLIIGHVVTGSTLEGMAEAARKYRAAIDKLGI